MDSLGQLERIFESYPEYRSECSLELASFIDFTARSKVKNIAVYEFTKIRIHLDALGRREGFPARMHHTVAFFDLLMFSIPFYTQLMTKTTITSWDEHRPLNIPKTNRTQMRWRNVLIKTIPDEQQYDYIGLIPFGFDNTIREGFEMLLNATARIWPIFNNLVSFGGLHNKIIICNWDYVLKKLNKGGY